MYCLGATIVRRRRMVRRLFWAKGGRGILSNVTGMLSGWLGQRPWSHHWLIAQCQICPAPLQPKECDALGVACEKTKECMQTQ